MRVVGFCKHNLRFCLSNAVYKGFFVDLVGEIMNRTFINIGEFRHAMANIRIREALPDDLGNISKVLAPAFSDKVDIMVGDEEIAVKIIPAIIQSLKAGIFVAVEKNGTGDAQESVNEGEGGEEGSGEGRGEGRIGGIIVGAIIVSTREMTISMPVVKACFRHLGFLGSMRAFRKVLNYLRSVPKKNVGEGTLEAVGVLESHRGQGIGEILVVTGEKYLKGKGKKYYGLGVKEGNSAVSLYEKLGFRSQGNYKNIIGTWIYMKKSL